MLVEDVCIVFIKMVDCLYNMCMLGVMFLYKQLKIVVEISYIYVLFVYCLGFYVFCMEFLDLCMKIIDLDDYFLIVKKLQEIKKNCELYIFLFIDLLKEQFDEIGIKYCIFGCVKFIYFIWNKLKNKQVVFEEIYDLFVVCIILDVFFKKEKFYCWQVYSVVMDVYKFIIECLKDWIIILKVNGYELLYIMVVGFNGCFVEV